MFLETQTLTPEQAKQVSMIHEAEEAKITAGANQSFVF
jgi:hypothetical protein